MKKQTYRPVEPRAGYNDHQRVVRRLRAAAADDDQSDAQRQWIRAATQC